MPLHNITKKNMSLYCYSTLFHIVLRVGLLFLFSLKQAYVPHRKCSKALYSNVKCCTPTSNVNRCKILSPEIKRNFFYLGTLFQRNLIKNVFASSVNEDFFAIFFIFIVELIQLRLLNTLNSTASHTLHHTRLF